MRRSLASYAVRSSAAGAWVGAKFGVHYFEVPVQAVPGTDYRAPVHYTVHLIGCQLVVAVETREQMRPNHLRNREQSHSQLRHTLHRYCILHTAHTYGQTNQPCNASAYTTLPTQHKPVPITHIGSPYMPCSSFPYSFLYRTSPARLFISFIPPNSMILL